MAPVPAGLVHPRERVRDDATLVARLGEQAAGAATRPVQVEWVCRNPAAVGERVLGRLPAGFDHALAVLADAETGTADGGHPRVRCREVRFGLPDVGYLVAAVSRGEVDGDSLEHTLDRDLVEGLDLIRRDAVLTQVAVGVRDDIGEPAGHDVVERLVQRDALAVRRADVQDVRTGGHRMHGFDVERLLAVPAGGVAAVRVLVSWRWLQCGVRREDVLGELRGPQRVTRVVPARVLVCVSEQRRGRERVEDRHRRPRPLTPLFTVPAMPYTERIWPGLYPQGA